MGLHVALAWGTELVTKYPDVGFQNWYIIAIVEPSPPPQLEKGFGRL
jgi:hypothetical protein